MTLPHDAQPYPGHTADTEPLLVRCLGCDARTLARVGCDRYEPGWALVTCEGMAAAGRALGLDLRGCGRLLWVDLREPEAQAWHAHVVETRAYRTLRLGVTTPPHAAGMWRPEWGPAPSRTPQPPPRAPALGDPVIPLRHLPQATYLDRSGQPQAATVCPDARTERGYLLQVSLRIDPAERLAQLAAHGVKLSTPADLAKWGTEPCEENNKKPFSTVRIRAHQGHGRGQFQPHAPLPDGYADPPRDPLAVSGGSAEEAP